MRLSDYGEQAGGFEAAFFSTFALAMLLYMAVIINGQGMATAIVEEKSSRLIEVILGAVTAGEFMAGKIIGVLGAGLTQLGIWVAVALVVVLQAIVMLARINILMPPLWEVWLSVALLLAASLAFAWAAGKIFRYALLMTGKRPTVPELLRVVRAG